MKGLATIAYCLATWFCFKNERRTKITPTLNDKHEEDLAVNELDKETSL